MITGRQTLRTKKRFTANFLRPKVSFIAYPFFIPKQDPVWHGLIKVLQPKGYRSYENNRNLPARKEKGFL